MTRIVSYSEFTELSEAVYADLNADEVTGSLIEKGFTDSQAQDFISRWTIVPGTHQPNTATGFSATVFQGTAEADTLAGQYVLAIRGTEPLTLPPVDLFTDVGDIILDGLAYDQIIDLYNYVQRLFHNGEYTAATLKQVNIDVAEGIKPQDYARDNGLLYLKDVGPDGFAAYYEIDFESRNDGLGLLPASTVFHVTGHSLGGHLAAAFSRLFPTNTISTTMVNGAGFGDGTPLLTNDFNVPNLFKALGGDAFFQSSQIKNLIGTAGWDFVAQDWFVGLQQPGTIENVFTESFNASNAIGHGGVQMTNSLAIMALFDRLDTTDNLPLATLNSLFQHASSDIDQSFERVVNDLSDYFKLERIGDINQPSSGAGREALWNSIIDIKTNIEPIENRSLESLVDSSYHQILDLAQDNSDTDQAMAYRYALAYQNPFVIRNDPNTLDTNHNAELGLELYDENTGIGNISQEFLIDSTEFLSLKLELAPENRDTKSLGTRVTTIYQSLTENSEVYEQYTLRGRSQGGSKNSYKIIGSDFDDEIIGQSHRDHLYGWHGDDMINGNDGNDYLEGQLGDDEIYGGLGRDHILGGLGDDSLHGATADQVDDLEIDVLEGGSGLDDYYVGQGDVVEDSDGKARIFFNDITVNGFFTSIKDDVAYKNEQKNLFLTIQGEDAVVTYVDPEINRSSTFRIRGFKSDSADFNQGDYGISLGTEASTDEPNNRLILPGYTQGQFDVRLFQNDALYTFTPETGIDFLEGQLANVDEIVASNNTENEQLFNNNTESFEIADDFIRVEQSPGAAIHGLDGRDRIVVDVEVPDIGYILLDGYEKFNFSLNQGFRDYIPAPGLPGTIEDEGIVVYAGDGPDSISGSLGADTIHGDAGDDVIEPFAGDDVINAGDGDDFIFSADYHHFISPELVGGNDILSGGSGDDEIIDLWGKDIVFGDEGNDLLAGGDDADILLGGADDDLIFGDRTFTAYPSLIPEVGFTLDFDTSGRPQAFTLLNLLDDGRTLIDTDENTVSADQITQGDDVIDGGAGNDFLIGNGGDDFISGGSGTDTLAGGEGMDQLFGGDGDDLLQGDIDDDYLNGDSGDDVILGGSGDDVLVGAKGDDFLQGGIGSDQLQGNQDDDTLVGNEGDDRLEGGLGNDDLYGGSGDDVLIGGLGNDSLYGGAGVDILFSSQGDYLDGGEGDDHYIIGEDVSQIFINDSEGNDVIELLGDYSAEDVFIENLNTVTWLKAMERDIYIYRDQSIIENIRFENGTEITDLSQYQNTEPLKSIPIDNQAIDQGQEYLFPIPESSFYDPDGHALTYDIYTLPSWLNFEAETGTFRGIPGNDAVGTHQIEFHASDIFGAKSNESQFFAITVNNVNDAPELIRPYRDVTVSAGFSFDYVLPHAHFVDRDAQDELLFSLRQANGQPLPEWLDYDSETSLLSGVPGLSTLGVYAIEIIAEDLNGATASDTFTLRVEESLESVLPTQIIPGVFNFGIFDYGLNVSDLGDVNNDGYNDFVIGTSTELDEINTDKTETHIIFGRQGGYGSSLLLNQISQQQGFTIHTPVSVSNGLPYGDEINLVELGDINGDGISDLGYADRISGGAGVIFGSQNGFPTEIHTTALNGVNGFVITGAGGYVPIPEENDGIYIGTEISSAGDVNGDGFHDLIVTNTQAYFNPYNAAVIFGRQEPYNSIIDINALNSVNGYRVNTQNGNSKTVSSIGDVNDDGFDDVIVAVDNQAHVIFGKATGHEPAIHTANLSATEGFQISLPQAPFATEKPSQFIPVGDLNADAIDDFAVQALLDHTYIFYGHENVWTDIQDLTQAQLSNTNISKINIPELSFNTNTIASGGDLNQDGIDDLLLASHEILYAIYGSEAGIPENLSPQMITADIGFAISIPATITDIDIVDDVNGDDIADILVGLASLNESYLIYGGTQDYLSLYSGSTETDSINTTGSNAAIFTGEGDDQITITDGTELYINSGGGEDYIQIDFSNAILDHSNIELEISPGDTVTINPSSNTKTVIGVKANQSHNDLINQISTLGINANLSTDSYGNSIRLGLGSLKITHPESGLEIHLEDFDPNDTLNTVRLFDLIEFNNQTLTYEQLLELGFDIEGTADSEVLTGTDQTDRIIGFSGNDHLIGHDGDDEITPGSGNDILETGLGDDTVFIQYGDGKDSLFDEDGTDSINLGHGIHLHDTKFQLTGFDLLAKFNDADSLRIENWSLSTAHQIEHWHYTEGDQYITGEEINLLISLGEPVDVKTILPYPESIIQIHQNASFTHELNLLQLDDSKIINTDISIHHNEEVVTNDAWIEVDDIGTSLSFSPQYRDEGKYQISIELLQDSGNVLQHEIGVVVTKREFEPATYESVDTDLIDLSTTTSFGENIQTINSTGTDNVSDATDPSLFIIQDDTGKLNLEFIKSYLDDDLSDVNHHEYSSVYFADESPSIHGTRDHEIFFGSEINNKFVGKKGDDIFIGDGGDDRIFAGAGNDILVGGTGNDRLKGGNGNDTYIFSSDEGQDVIKEKGGYDSLYLSGYDFRDIWFWRERDDLKLTFHDSDDSIKIKDWYRGTPNQLDSIIAGGQGMNIIPNQIHKLVDAMAIHATELSTDAFIDTAPPESLEPIITASWTPVYS